MSFMQRFTLSGAWITFDTREGGHVLPADVVLAPAALASVLHSWGYKGEERDAARSELINVLRELGYSDIHRETLDIRIGWGARYSAPGYMDCTDWCGPYLTCQEAEQEADRLYGDADAAPDAECTVCHKMYYSGEGHPSLAICAGCR